MVSVVGSKQKKTKAALLCAAASVTAATSSILSPPLSASSFSSSQHQLNSQQAAVAISLPRGGGTKDNNESRSNSTPDKKKKRHRRRHSRDEEEGSTEGDGSPTNDEKDKPSKKERHQQKNRNSQPNKKQQEQRQTAPQPKPPPEIEEILQEDDYYRILGLTREEVAAKGGGSHASSLITKAYRRRCILTHPDKTGGDRRAFDKVAEAYEVLSDDEKRHIYDRLGKRGLDGQHGGGQASFTDAQELFRRFFGGVPGGAGGDGFGQQRHPRPRNRTARYQLEVTLEDLYRGMTRTVEVEAPVDVWNRQRMARSPTSSKHVEVHIPRGAMDGESVVLSGAMDFAKDETPGDLVFIVHQRPHPTFVRKGYDLAINVRIRMKEAVCGMTRTVQHLDGRTIEIGSARRQRHQHSPQTASMDDDDPPPVIIKTGDVHVLKGEGMPKDEIGTSFGDLYIVYEVVMPKPRERSRSVGSSADDEFTSEDRAELGRLLDKLEGVTDDASSSSSKTGSTKPVYLEKAALSDFGRASGQPHRKRDSSQEYGPEAGQDFFGSGDQFFFSSSAASAAAGGNPFFGMHRQFGHGFPADEDGGDENVQCRQM